MLLNENKSKSWDEFLSDDMLKKLSDIESKLGNDYTPAKENILRFMNNDLEKMKVCIVGQDPYYSLDHGEPVAIGRAFQPNNLISWSQSFRQVSLKNMVRLVYKAYNDIEDYKEIKKYKEIVKEIESGEFPILQPREWYNSMEQQGVLFLNRYLTTKVGIPNAHRHIWNDFMGEVIHYMGLKKSDMNWFLWGNEALGCEKIIEQGIFYKSRHPMMCSEKYPDDFLKSDCFKATKDMINWLG